MTLVPSWGFVGPTYVDYSRAVAAQECINLIPRVVEARAGKTVEAFYRTPGYRAAVRGLHGPVRGMKSHNGRHVAIAGGRFYELTKAGTDWSATEVDAVAENTYPATIDANTTQMFAVSGLRGYIFDLALNTLTRITSAGFPAEALMGAYIEDFFAVLHADRLTWGISALSDGLTWDALDIAQKQLSADKIRALIGAGRNVNLLGFEKSEEWYNVGDTFPYAPAPNALTEFGAIAQGAACVVNGIPAWIAVNSAGARVAFVNGRAVSTAAIERAWQQYGESVDDVDTWSYNDGMGEFVVFSFPVQRTSWVYSTRSGYWHKWLHRDTKSGRYEAHLGRCHMHAAGDHLIGSRRDGTIYVLDMDEGTEDGDPVRWLRASPHVASNGAPPYTYNSLEVFFDRGVGTLSSPNDDPQAELRYSNDGSNTWEATLRRPMGRRGKYLTKAVYGPLGDSEDRVFELSGSHAVRTVITGAALDVDPGVN